MPRRNRLQDMPRLVAVDGPLGVGKRALITYLIEQTGARLTEVNLAANPFLEDVFAETSGRVFSAQMCFLLARYQLQQELRQEELFDGYRVLNGHFSKDRVYAEALLSSPELELYKRISALLEPRTVHPDILVVLRASPRRLLERLKARSLEREQAISLDFLDRICRSFSRLYDNWSSSPILFVDVNHVDLNEQEDVLASIVQEMRRTTSELNAGEAAFFDPISGVRS